MREHLEFNCIIYDDYKELLKKNVYEPIILRIMNSSHTIFKEEYTYIKNQSHNESDYVSTTGINYDAKILFYERQCQALAINKDNLYTFITSLQNEINEIYEAIKNNDEIYFTNSIFYKEMVLRIKKAEPKENIILFLPFACTKELSTDLNSILENDLFTYIFKIIKKNNPNLIKNHNIYMIYPNLENYIIIKRLNDNILEFVMDDILTKYIKFEISR